MKHFFLLFKKVGGKEILRQYRQAHVLMYSLVSTVLLGFSKKSLEIVRLAVSNRILCKMRKRYSPYIKSYVNTHQEQLERKRSNIVWILWLQGIEHAPQIVKKCYQSITENLREKEIILLTEENYKNYVQFPQYIQEKIDCGVITKTHMSDLLRLKLLNTYGGTWIDATVYCSGKNIPYYMLDSDLFLFQNLKPGLDGQCTCISSWFMTASTNNPILLLTQQLLFEYWKKNTKMVDYFLLHDFFQLSIEAYPDEWKKVIPFCNSLPHILLLRLFDQYDADIWTAVREQTPFHKMTYKFLKDQAKIKGTYYDIIFNMKETPNE